MSSIRATTQEFLQVADIRDDFVILKDGAVVAILETTAVNFDLLSEREQEAMIESYGGLLNSVSFPIQIVVSSQRLDISSYLEILEDLEKKKEDKSMKEHIHDYHKFVESLVTKNRVLDKEFYVVIPHRKVALSVDNSLTKGIQNFLQKLRGKKIEETPKFSSKEQVERALPKIEPKIEHVEKQLRRIGIDSRRLENKGLLKLFYSIYNADAET